MQIIRWRAASIKSAPKPTRFLVRLTKVGAFFSGIPTLLTTEPFGNGPNIGAILNIRGIRNGCKRRLIEPTHRAERDVVPVPLRFCLDSPDMYVVETYLDVTVAWRDGSRRRYPIRDPDVIQIGVRHLGPFAFTGAASA